MHLAWQCGEMFGEGVEVLWKMEKALGRASAECWSCNTLVVAACNRRLMVFTLTLNILLFTYITKLHVWPHMRMADSLVTFLKAGNYLR